MVERFVFEATTPSIRQQHRALGEHHRIGSGDSIIDNMGDGRGRRRRRRRMAEKCHLIFNDIDKGEYNNNDNNNNNNNNSSSSCINSVGNDNK